MARTMTLVNVIKRMHRRYQGDTKYPAWGSDDNGMYIDIINDLKDEVATDGDHQMSCYFEERDFGVTNATDLQYDLDDDVNELSDYVYIDTVDGRTVTFPVIREKDRHSTSRTQHAFISGDFPNKSANFTSMPTACIGGTIRAGIYFVPPDVSKQNEVVPVPRPQWLIYAGAAELAFNDPSKEDKFPDLLGLANDEYQKMMDAYDTLPQNQIDDIPTEGMIDPAGSSWGDC